MKHGILVVHGEGLGNIVQILPLLSVLDRAIGLVDLALPSSSFDIPESLFTGRRVFLPDAPIPQDYIGKVQTIWGSIHGRGVAPSLATLNDIGKQQMRLDCSEVGIYLQIASELGISDKPTLYDYSLLLGHEPTDERFDVVVSNGYNWKMGDLWAAKSYPHYQEVVAALTSKGLTVCSIGAKQEYVPGTVDRTGIGLMKTLGLIKNCKVVISNDSGFYHCACAFGRPCVVVFTFTSVTKNRDPSFHRSAVVMERKLSCRMDCHARQKWRTCATQDCRKVPVRDIVNEVVGIIG